MGAAKQAASAGGCCCVVYCMCMYVRRGQERSVPIQSWINAPIYPIYLERRLDRAQAYVPEGESGAATPVVREASA